MLRLAREARRDMVVGHVDEHEMRDQAVRCGELAAQLPFLGAHALANRACGLSHLDDVAFHHRSLSIARTQLSCCTYDASAPGACRARSRNSSSGGFAAGF